MLAPTAAVPAQQLLHGCPTAWVSGRSPPLAMVVTAGHRRIVPTVLCTALCSCTVAPFCSVCLLASSGIYQEM
ncbi:hypothetical protein BDA96_01G243300 [Sorghum bicolor]|uniref:Uncharacterized protein n=2 Tax=Sorghum bicolor TaxID=4558 RepID=A0A921S0Y5_SORBI|nr:hypothetical protein BDA96_01G243300 [Sorghum bicolor]KXG38407.1 hypothetical protein SORBI_3001G228700 [Sorghum bicolor]